jgi:subtilase family serine protease
MANSYNYAGLHATDEGQGETIAIIDSFGSSTITSDLAVFNTDFSLPHMCGETGPDAPSGCSAGMPNFSVLCYRACTTSNPPPPSSGTQQEASNLWALEVSLDVEWAHATAPLANILLVTTPTAETLGVQGFQQFMNAEQFVVDHHLADVITQSFGAGEGSFHNGLAAINQLRQAFIDAKNNDVTVLASSGDGGTKNPYKSPVKEPATIPYPSVIWPASDPLVTAVGGTYLCTDPVTGLTVDSTDPPKTCQNHAGVREIGWLNSGGGYSILFPRPSYQDTLPTGSSYVGSSTGAPGPNSDMRGVPDVAYQASSRTGVLVYLTEPYPPGATGTGCGAERPCDPGWYIVGGTSAGSPQWAGIVAMADEMAGHDLGFLNPKLYSLASDPLKYANDFYDVMVGCNDTFSTGTYCTSQGWDAVTGLGTPNVAKLVHDLAS